MTDVINEDITDIRKGRSRTLQLADSWFLSLDAPIFYWVLCLYQHGRPDSHAVWRTSSAQGLLFDVCRQRGFLRSSLNEVRGWCVLTRAWKAVPSMREGVGDGAEMPLWWGNEGECKVSAAGLAGGWVGSHAGPWANPLTALCLSFTAVKRGW